MKRTITALLAALMLLTLAACGSNSDPSGNGDAAVGGTTDSTEEATATVSGVVNRLDDYLVLLTEDETYAVFDFGEDALGERLDGDTTSGGFLREILTVDVIEGGKVIHVGKEAGGLDDFIERAACFCKDGF